MMTLRLFRIVFTAGLVLTAAGCALDSGTYQDNRTYTRAVYGEIARRAAAYEGPDRNPVVVIHGLLGSQLVDATDGRNVWGFFSLGEMRRGDKYLELAHPMGLNIPLSRLHSNVRATSLLERSMIQVLGFQFNQDNYDILVKTLADSGYVPDNRPLPRGRNFHSQFIFYYDWRRDISENAVRLAEFIEEKRAYLQERYATLYGLEDYDVRFNLVAHSMGGLVAGYYLRFGGEPLPDDPGTPFPVTWAGAARVDKLIMIATPNAGYVDTLLEMVNGLRLTGNAPPYPPAVVGSFVSMYQMMPAAETMSVIRHDGTPVDLFDPEQWLEFKWGLANPAHDAALAAIMPLVPTPEARREIALDHLRKCLSRARQFHRAMRIPAEHPESVGVFLIAGDALETNRQVAVDPASGTIGVVRRDAGDGKITSASARFDLRDTGLWAPCTVSPIDWDGAYYLQGGHMGVMTGEVFSSNLRYLLLSWPVGAQNRLIDEIPLPDPVK